jgi:hypothetical protein
MTDQLIQLVHFIGEESELLTHVRQAVAWVECKPEGLAILKEAKALHGKPLKIVIDSKTTNVGYGINGEHIVHANPLVSNHYIFRGQNGENIHGSTERFISHELAHAAQKGVLQQGEAKERLLEIYLNSFSAAVPIDSYFHRLEAAKHNNVKIRKILGEMYDEHIVVKQQQLMEDIIQKISEDPLYQAYVKEYEVPAIEFENLLMRYKDEPKRSTDYVSSAIYDELFNNETAKEIDREAFIQGGLTSLVAAFEQEIKQGRPYS